MNEREDEPAPIAVAISFKTRLAIYSVSGAIVGLLFVAPFSILMDLLVYYWSQPWLVFLDFWSPLGGNFWRFVGERSEAFMRGSIFGLIGGAITSIFSNRTRHPIALASLWLSILATPGLVIQFLFHDARSMDDVLSNVVLPIGLVVVLGAMYGLLLGSLARLFERWLEKRRLHRVEPLASIERR